MSSTKELSNISYTNKDFNSIYVELLEYAKKLSYKWDPTASDESDPGVVLLKLISIIGDKDNYNIDKNVLELMPASVSQLSAARQIFEQCGYIMRHYRSAQGTVNLTLVTEPDKASDDTQEYLYNIPMFTMLTDNDNSIIYTTTEPVTLGLKSTKSVNVIEGTVSSYTINNDPLITLLNLDNNKRLYFSDLSVAENGIFITNVGENNYTDWERVDNIEIQEASKKCYRFGLTLDNSACFIEFPENISSLFGQGINISYVSTTGLNGNVAAKKLTKFYADVKAIKSVSGSQNSSVGEEVTLTSDNVKLSNSLAITNGADPESIDEAYRNYKRVKDTFDTLVSLKDYSDYMLSEEYASNGFVCDRTNDVQHSYKLKQQKGGTTSYETYVEIGDPLYKKIDNNTYEEIEQPTMTPFDLCVYALEYQANCFSEDSYKRTFMLTHGTSYKKALNSDAVKSIQHSFKDFETNRILLIKNKYPIKSTIIPRYKLTLSEKFEVEDNIRKALYQAINAKYVDFGSPASYDLIYDTIEHADPRIKAISVSYPTYETYAVYLSETVSSNGRSKIKEFKELRIDNNYDITRGLEEISEIDKGELAELISSNRVLDKDYVSVKPEDNIKDDERYYKIINTDIDADTYMLRNKFRCEIFAKNILAGVTPLYDKASNLTFGVAQQDTKYIEGIEKISTQTKLALTKPTDDTKNYYETSVLGENESVLLVAPSLIEDTPYSSYVKIIYHFNVKNGADKISAEEYYELTGDEYIIFFWKATNTDEYYTYTKYSANSDIKIISPSFSLNKKQDHGNFDGKIKMLDNGVKNKLTDSDLNEYISNLTGNPYVLTGTQVITTYKPNEIHLNNTTNGAQDVYWMLNNYDLDKGSTLFEAPPEFNGTYIQEYTLKAGEYLLYTNPAKTILYIQGEGTLLRRECSSTYSHGNWNIPYVDRVTYEKLLTEGLSILEDKWFQIPPGENLYSMEMQQVLIGPGNKIRLKPNEDNSEKFDSDATVYFPYTLLPNESPTDMITSLSDYTISYVDEKGQETHVKKLNLKDAGWTGTSLLNINLSHTSAQRLLEHQKFVYDSSKDAITKSAVLSDYTVAAVGGKDVIVKARDSFAKLIPINLLTFTERLDESKKDNNGNQYNIKYNKETFECILNIEGNGEEQIIYLESFTLLKGNYLVTFSLDGNTKSFAVNSGTNTVTLTKLFNTEQVIGNVMTYRIVVTEETSDVVLKLTLELEGNSTIVISPLFKYKTDTLQSLSKDFESSVLDTLTKYKGHSTFDYTQDIDNAIINPLNPETFVLSHHICCPYTICEWQESAIDGSDIAVTTDLK